MTNFVLVHGAFHGGWCWRRVAQSLRRSGHEVSTPTLTGLGERSHLASPTVTLSTHVDDVVMVLEFEDLDGVVLVGHSYAGMVFPGVAERAHRRLEHLVYLDAFVPEHGQRCFDLMPEEHRDGIRAQAEAEGEGWRFFPFPLELLGPFRADDARWVEPRLVPQPLGTYDEPVHAAGAAWKSLSRTYVLCTESPLAGVMEPFAAKARAEPGWRYAELASAHDAMVTAPDALVSLLLEAASEPA